jgi:prolyl-tRNA synthetase
LWKLIKVIDEELDSIGAQKMSMPTLAKAELWKKTSKFSFILSIATVTWQYYLN